jgi:peptidylprolyl isomerase/FKBP-type peptidyl-prolyl cis-trans isomerase FkpA
MKYKNLYLGFVFIVMLSITTAFFILNKNDDKNLKEPVDIPLNTKANLLGQSDSDNTQQLQTNQNNSNSLSVQKPNQNTQPNNQNQLPSPDRFTIYEEYSASESALYIDTRIGDGKEVQNGNNVAVLYKGYLTSGELFDQNRLNEENKLEPFVFQVGSGQVIPGWEATIPGMKAGGSRRLIIPAQFGYGPSGQGQIPPNSMLIFDVDLVAVE